MYQTLLSPRLRRVFTSSFFGATFFGAFLTVAATTAFAAHTEVNGERLPLASRACPAQQRKLRDAQASRRSRRAGLDEAEVVGEEDGSTSDGVAARVGERIRLTSKGGWIEIPDVKPAR